MTVLSALTSYLVVALCFFWLAHNTEAFPASRLPGLCRHTKLALLLGSQCDPYIQIDVDCEVSYWTAWARHYENGCAEKRTRYVQKFQRNNGEPCPPLEETRPCQSLGKSEVKKTLNKLKTGLGGFGAVGPGHNHGKILGNTKVSPHLPAFNARLPRRDVSDQTELTCPPDRDIVLVVDSSASVNRTNFEQAFVDFSLLIPHLCGFQPDIITRCRSTRVAIVTYGEKPRLVFDLNHSKNRHSFQNNVQYDIQILPRYLSWLDGFTATGDALQFVADRVLQEAHGMRHHGTKAIILFTDGRTNHGRDPVTVAGQLYDQYKNLAIIALGIGSQISYDELVGITNHHNSNNFKFPVLFSSYQSFTNIVSEITSMLGKNQDTCRADILDKK